jgi:hypothetical protein
MNILKAPYQFDLFEYHVRRKDPLTPTLIDDFYYYPEGHNSDCYGECRISGYRKYKQKIL